MNGSEFIKQTSLKLNITSESPNFLNKNIVHKLEKPKEVDFFIKLIRNRRSIRHYSNRPLNFNDFSYILYSASGISKKKYNIELKTNPSAGGLYPIKIFVSVFNIDRLEKGLYLYDEKLFALNQVSRGNYTKSLSQICLSQDFIEYSSAMIILVAKPILTTSRYGERGFRYLMMDSAYISSNIYLASTNLNVGSCAIGAFIDKAFNDFLKLDGEEEFVILAHTIGTKNKQI